MSKINIGLIGCGTMGTFLLEKLNQEKVFPTMKITAVFDEREKSQALLENLSQQFDLVAYDHLDHFLNSNIDIVVECASVAAVQRYAQQVIQKKDIVIISVGALVDHSFYAKLRATAHTHKRKIHLPSGAIGGLDVIKAANITGGLESVTLTTRKPASTLVTESLHAEKVLFDGTANEAIKDYPKNINVSIILSLAGIGVEKTRVKIIADPFVEKNSHSIHAKGDFGEFRMTVENNPLPGNPSTSYLTALSILASLQSLQENL